MAVRAKSSFSLVCAATLFVNEVMEIVGKLVRNIPGFVSELIKTLHVCDLLNEKWTDGNMLIQALNVVVLWKKNRGSRARGKQPATLEGYCM